MAASMILYILIGIIVFDYILERWLDYLNVSHRKPELPLELQGLYDAEKYKQSQDYERINYRFSFIQSSYSFVLVLLLFIFGGFAFVDGIARQLTQNPILITISFFLIFGFVLDLLSTPFDIYGTFVIEQKFKFNTTTPKTYLIDKLKGWGLSLILGGSLLALITWFYYATTSMFWIYTWGAVIVYEIFITMFYTSLILPLFNKQTPLEQGELRTGIEALCKKADFKLDNIFVMDGSKRSTKANAFFSGLGSRKRIVLYDTLIKDLTVGETIAVLAHEIGHNKKKHTQYNIVISFIQTGIVLYILSLFISNPQLSQALGYTGEQAVFHLGLIAFGILFSPVSHVLGIGMNVLSRRFEYQADRFASQYYDGGLLASALKKLSINHLSNLTPHPVYVFFNYSHPPLLQRLRALS